MFYLKCNALFKSLILCLYTTGKRLFPLLVTILITTLGKRTHNDSRSLWLMNFRSKTKSRTKPYWRLRVHDFLRFHEFLCEQKPLQENQNRNPPPWKTLVPPGFTVKTIWMFFCFMFIFLHAQVHEEKVVWVFVKTMCSSYCDFLIRFFYVFII